MMMMNIFIYCCFLNTHTQKFSIRVRVRVDSSDRSAMRSSDMEGRGSSFVIDPKDWNIKDLLYLALCWALTLTTSTLLTTIGPLAAKHVGSSDILAPFTIGTFLLGAAFSSVPSGPLFRKYGRYGGFAVGCACQMIGSGAGALGMIVKDQSFLFIGCFFVGLGQVCIYIVVVTYLTTFIIGSCRDWDSSTDLLPSKSPLMSLKAKPSHTCSLVEFWPHSLAPLLPITLCILLQGPSMRDPF
jgi:hypothetical protein